MRPAVRRGNSWIMHQGSPCQTTPLQSRCLQSEALKQHGGMKEKIQFRKNYEVIVSLFSDCIFLLHTMSSFVTPNPSHWAHFQSFICLQLLPCYTWCPPKQTKLPWVASEAGNDTRPVAFCARFRKNGAKKKRVKRWNFPTGVETNSLTRKRRVKWFSGVLFDIYCACIMHSPQDMSPASSKQPVAV